MKKNSEHVLVGDDIAAANADWRFSGDVARGYDAHVVRSVPLYNEGHTLVRAISDFFMLPNSLCYELGAGTGTLLKVLAEHNAHKEGVRFVGVEKEEDMAAIARERVGSLPQVEVVVGDVASAEYEPADFIVSYYTLQFVRPRLKQEVIDRVYESLQWGGGFVLFEKVRACDARFQDMMSSLYTEFKLEQGYSGEELVQKSRSLKGVLEPFSSQANVDMLKRAGFSDVISVFKYICFEGFLAIK